MLRIEEFKDRLSRNELLAIADEAVRELEVGSDEQLVLTEVLMLEHVDRLIMHRLSLPTFRRWRTRHVRLRDAQRAPTHWGIDPRAPVATLARSLDVDGCGLVIGASASSIALFLAAHDWSVVFVDQELGAVEAAETRAAAEALALNFQALMVSLGGWFPDVTPALTVFDPRTLAALDGEERDALVSMLKSRTPKGGVHCLMPAYGDEDGVIRIAPETIKVLYEGWQIDRGAVGESGAWFVARQP